MKARAVGGSIAAVLLLVVVSVSTLIALQRPDQHRDAGHQITRRSSQFRPRIVRTDGIEHVGVERKCKEDPCPQADDPGSGEQSGNALDSDDEDETDEENWLPLDMYDWPVPKPVVSSNDTGSMSDSSKGGNKTAFVYLVGYDSQLPHFKTSAACKAETELSDLCKIHPTILPAIIQGVQMAVDEATKLLGQRRWDGSALKKTKYGQSLLKKATREAAFTHAIISAGIAHSVTKACKHHQIDGCGCVSNKTPEASSEAGVSSGCSDDVYFGTDTAAKFVNAQEKGGRDLRTQVNLHNNKAGRLVLISEQSSHCKCHGTSGSCALRTCWMSLNPFENVGNHILQQYDQAVQVATNSLKQGGGFLTAVSGFTFGSFSHPNLLDLVFYEKSPKYCERDRKIGSLGTKGRKCQPYSTGSDSCLHLCCRRGFKLKMEVETYDCECKFTWCCRVECKKCKIKRPYHVCR